MKQICQIAVKPPMQSRILLVLILIGLGIGASFGYFAGRRSMTKNSTQAPLPSSPQVENDARANSRQRAATGTAFNTDDLETRLRKLGSGPMRKRWDNLRDLARSIPPGDEA